MKSGLPSNELGFLYKKCRVIRPSVISALGLIPEYMKELKEYHNDLNDRTVFEIVRDTYKVMQDHGESYKAARDVINKISRDLYGDPHAWQYK